MNADTGTENSPLAFFLLAGVLSLPFWLVGALSPVQILPGIPLSGFGFTCIPTAAAILAYRQRGFAGVTNLLKRSLDWKRIQAKIWFVPTVLLMPCIMSLSYWVTKFIGIPLPVPQLSLARTIALLIAFFVGALSEELGWSGYAIDPLQDRFGAVWAGIFLGLVWAAFHFVPLVEAHRSLLYMAWWSLGTVAIRVIIVWLYNNTGKSVFAAALFHTMINVTWQLFPINGSYYDPRVTSPIISVVAVLVVALWGSRTRACKSHNSKRASTSQQIMMQPRIKRGS